MTDRPVCRYVWRDEATGEIKHYEMSDEQLEMLRGFYDLSALTEEDDD